MSFKQKKWRFMESDSGLKTELTQALGIHPVLAQILLNRGLVTVREADKFLNANLTDLYNPYLLKDISKAVRRVREAIDRSESILIFGDKDVDGMTGTALLVRLLRQLKAKVKYYVPGSEDYGMDIETIKRAASAGISLIISVDCGVGNFEEIKAASELGLDVVVLDHHEAPPVLPEACAVVDPKQKDCAYPFQELSGVGVAFKFGQALVSSLDSNCEEVDINSPPMKSFLENYLDLVALGTIADVVPLLDENRILVKEGLERLGKTKTLGLVTLLRRLNLNQPTTIDVGWRIAPLLNAAGRRNEAGLGVELLISDRGGRTVEIVDRLIQLNEERKNRLSETLSKLSLEIPSEPDENIIVIASPFCERNLTGLIAGRLKDRFMRPVVVLTTEEKAKGSVRSIDAFDLTEILPQCEDLLINYGGHKKAAGLSLCFENIEPFKRRMEELARTRLNKNELVTEVAIEAQISVSDISFNLVDQLARLSPFGTDNPEPIFSSAGIRALEVKKMGDTQSHLRLLMEDNGDTITAVGWKMGALAPLILESGHCDLAFKVEVNSWKGREELRLNLEDVRAAGN
ncbi:MAG: single-stranded-DNA-specific exonuclease RecJ [bacterium]|nr:single-stranded-DNA-specific exonuclease RecJ [bacterium]